MAIWPWYGLLAQGGAYDVGEYLDVASYANLQRWTDLIARRPAVGRGHIVDMALPERHSATNIDKALAQTAKS